MDDKRAKALGYVDARARREFFITATAALLFSTTTTHAALVALALEHSGYDLRETGFLIGVLGVSALVGTLGSGYVAARTGAVAAFRIAMVCAAIGVASMAVTRHYFWLAILSRLVWGFGVGLFLGPINLYAQSRLTPLRFVYLVTAFSSMIPIALAMAPPIGEFVLNRFGENAMFIEGGMPAAIACVISGFLRPLPPPPKPRGLGIISAWRGWHTMPIAALIIGGAQFGYVTSYLAPEMRDHNILLGWFFVPMTITTIGARVFAMRRLAALHPRWLMASGLTTGGLAIVAAGFPDRWLVALGGLLLGYGNSMMFPIMSAWLGRRATKANAPGAQAIVATGFYFGIYWTPWPVAWIIDAFGYSVAQWSLFWAGMAVAAAIVASRVDGAFEDA